MRAAPLLAAVFVCALLAGTARAAIPDTKGMVLKLSDLPALSTAAGGYYADNVRAAKESTDTTLAEFKQQGRITGYTVDYWIDSTTAVTSRASTFKTVKGSTSSLHHSFATSTRPQTSDNVTFQFKQLAALPRIGDEARTYSATFTSGDSTMAIFAILWRYKTVKAQFFLVGEQGKVNAAAATALARKQQLRIATALR